jgi:uncharacterized protein YfbU (UPF0304 family)
MAMGGTRRRKTPKVAISGCARLSTVYPCPNNALRPFNKFAGYDGNNEAKFMSFARFTVERLKRFEYVPMQKPGYWNSHMPVRDIYGRMLAEWIKEPMPERMTMSEARLKAVLAAAIHPENR